ncbi:MAG: hypothetical protein ABJP34_05805 [Erythrobacter sp.]
MHFIKMASFAGVSAVSLALLTGCTQSADADGSQTALSAENASEMAAATTANLPRAR